jgi:hypothetical protein
MTVRSETTRRTTMTNHYRRLLRWAAPLAGAAWLSLAGCQADTAADFRNVLTGEECVPDDTYEPRPGHSSDAPGHTQDNPGHGGDRSPTGIPGDNMDDEHSGKVDCLGDGNSGQGDDKKHNCEFPPGCDQNGCCDGDVDPPQDDPGSDDPGSDDPGSDDPGSDDPGSDDPGSDDPGSEVPPPDQPPPPAPTCDQPCGDAGECSAEQVCVNGCCEILVQ